MPGIVYFKRFDDARIAPQQQRTRMPGAGKAQFAFSDVCDAIECCRQKWLGGAPEDRVKAAVDFTQKRSGVHGDGDQFLDEPAQNGGDQCGPHPMTHDVTDKNACDGISDWKYVEKIAAHSRSRKVAMIELQGAG